jgi:hypothetical protein
MTLPVITGTSRVSLEWHNVSLGVPATTVNVLHVQGSTGNESAIASDLATTLAANQVDALFSLSNAYHLTNITVTPLDGTSAGQVFPQTGIAGQASGQVIPQCAVVWTFYTGHRGPRGRGRIYLGPITETINDDGDLVVGGADPGTAIQAILDDMSGAGHALRVASYLHMDAHDITSFTIHPVIRTQRRRARK